MENYNELSKKLKEENRVIVHEENIFLEKGKFDRKEDFHPKPSVGINAERSLMVMEVFAIISQGVQFYKGIVYDSSRKVVVVKTDKNNDGSESYSEHRDILGCSYMSEFGKQITAYGGNTKTEIIEKFIDEFQ